MNHCPFSPWRPEFLSTTLQNNHIFTQHFIPHQDCQQLDGWDSFRIFYCDCPSVWDRMCSVRGSCVTEWMHNLGQSWKLSYLNCSGTVQLFYILTSLLGIFIQMSCCRLKLQVSANLHKILWKDVHQNINHGNFQVVGLKMSSISSYGTLVSSPKCRVLSVCFKTLTTSPLPLT